MSDPAIGFSLAVFGAVPFAAYILPRKLSRLPVLEYQFWLSCAIAPVAVVVAIIVNGGIDTRWELALAAFSCGPLWALGSICYSLAVDNIGVARSTPVKNLAPMWAAIYGVVFFQEYTISDPASLVMALGGVGFMVWAAGVLGKAGAPEKERAFAYDMKLDADARAKAMRLGWIFSWVTAVFYGAYSIPLKYVLRGGMSAYAACAYLGIGVFVSSLIFYFLRTRRLAPKFPAMREFWLTQMAGGIWVTGQITGTVAMVFIPMAISWPVTNISTLLAIGWGVWVFKEVQLEKHKKEVIWSMILYTVGLILLAIAAPKGNV